MRVYQASGGMPGGMPNMPGGGFPGGPTTQSGTNQGSSTSNVDDVD